MLKLTPTPETIPVWMVQLQAELTREGRPSLTDDDVEPMVELMYRTAGIRSVAVVLLESGLAVAVGIEAPDATAALERARGLTIAAARYAGMGTAAVQRARVTLAPEAGTA